MSPSPVHVAVVIPAYQAARTLPGVLRDVPALVQTIVVVDDASTDGTLEAARAAARDDARVVAVRREANGGVGAAVLTGYREALDRGAAIVVKVDADGQMDLAQLDRLLEPILAGRADYAKGNRLSTSRDARQMPFVRLLGNSALSFLTKLSSGAWHVLDPTNGYTAIHARALEAMDWSRVHPRWFFESSMLCVLTVARAVIEDVTMPARYLGQGSHLSLGRAAFEFPILHLRQAWWRFVRMYVVGDFNACSLMIVLGLPLLGFGVAFGLAAWIHSTVTGRFASTGTVMIPALTTILGFQLLLQALVLDVGSAPRRPLQGRS